MKKALALILVLVMLCSMMPMTAFATEKDHGRLSLEGLNVLCLGDSITAGQGLTTDTRWTNVLASKYGWHLTNKSQGGISLSSYYYTANGKSDVSIAKKAEILKTMTTKPDVIIVWGGHNDTSYRASPLGTWDDETTNSFKGALKHIAELTAEYAPDATLFVLTPLWATEAPSTLKVPENTTDNNWMFVDAIYDGAEAYGWIPINMDLCGITPFTISGLTLDGVHPNAAGTEKIVEYLSAELASYGANSKKETIIFNKSAVSMKTGESITLKAVLSPRSGTGTMTFTWSSSDSSVATVDANGKIIAVAPGNAIITATTTNGISAGFGVSVVCEHTYESSVTAPTCTEQGYTTYTCECGDSYVDDYVDATGHTYENGICTGCGVIVDGGMWQIVENGEVIGAYGDLQSAIDACEVGGTIRLTANCSVTSGVKITKDITIDGGNFLVDISGCLNEFIYIGENVAVTLRDLKLDGGATGFEVDYDAVTYTNFTIPLVSGSLRDDPRANKSAILSSGTLICENVDISNRYTASVGGAMQILAGRATLTDCDFTHNYGTSKGGALYIGSNLGTRTEYPMERVTITGCTFTYNYTGHGGAIYAYNMAEMVIENSDFVGNTANGGKGGAIDLCSETTHPTTAMALGLDFMQTTIRGCRFENNWAGNDGFAIQSYDSDLYLYNSDFIGNVGVHQGSSVGTISTESFRYTDPSQRIYTLMDGCLFEDNKGPCAVYGDHNSVSDLDVRNCEFRNNTGKDSFLLYSAVSNITNCRFVGETTSTGVIDAIIIENYDIPPALTLTDVSFIDCTTPVEILTRKYGHDTALQTYNVILQGTTNGDIAIWDNNAVSVQGNHIGNLQLAFDTERSSLTIGKAAVVNGIIYAQPRNTEAPLNERFCVTVEAEGEGLKYQWYFRNPGSDIWYKSSVRDNTYDDVMTTARAGREVYCVITDANGNSVTTDIAKLIRIPAEELEIVTQPTNGEAILGERYCVTVEAKGEGLKYQWYFRNAGTETWYTSSVRDNTYDDVMTTARAGREVYCVITDAFGNKVKTDVVTLIRVPVKLEITIQPTDTTAAFGEMFCATVEAKGDGLKYQWYFRNAGTDTWYTSGVRDNTYDDIMTKARNGREVYCVVTDQWGNSVTTDTVKLIAVPMVELKLLGVSYESAAMGENYCATVEAEGEGLKYTWYFCNAGSDTWYRSGVTDNTYDDVMTKARANREVYCVITDAYGNQITTEVITLELRT